MNSSLSMMRNYFYGGRNRDVWLDMSDPWTVVNIIYGLVGVILGNYFRLLTYYLCRAHTSPSCSISSDIFSPCLLQSDATEHN